MNKIYYPVLCIDSNSEINVSPSTDKAALWDHCYHLQRLYPERIDGFFIYPVDKDNDAAFIQCIEVMDRIRALRDTLALHTSDEYINHLFSLNKEALEVIESDLMVQEWARNN